MNIKGFAATAAILASLAVPVALAQDNAPMDHSKMGHGMMMMDNDDMSHMNEMMDQMTGMMSQMREMMMKAHGGQGMQGMQGGMQHDMGTPKGDQGPSSKEFAEANAKMHAGMDIQFSGDADVDFAKSMIAHHEGAVAMAEVVLRYGKDEELKKLAQQIIASQEPEIAFMKAWLTKHGQ